MCTKAFYQNVLYELMGGAASVANLYTIDYYPGSCLNSKEMNLYSLYWSSTEQGCIEGD